VPEAHYTGSLVNELSGVEQYKMRCFDTVTLKPGLGVTQGHWNDTIAYDS